MAKYIEIESAPAGFEDKIRDDLKFKAGKFVWRIQFNTPLDSKTVNNMNLYVTTTGQTPLKTSIRYDAFHNYIEVEPLEAYTQNESYILNITTNVKSAGGKRLKSPIRVQFRV